MERLEEFIRRTNVVEKKKEIALNPLMLCGNKRSHILNQICSFIKYMWVILQVCLSICGILLPPGSKGLKHEHQNQFFLVVAGICKNQKFSTFFLRMVTAMPPGTIIHAIFNNIKSQGISKEFFFSAFPNIEQKEFQIV